MIPRAKQCCGNCDFSLDDGHPTDVLCRREPPTPVFYGMQQMPQLTGLQIKSQPNMIPVVVPHFPQMNKQKGWCGKWGSADRRRSVRSSLCTRTF